MDQIILCASLQFMSVDKYLTMAELSLVLTETNLSFHALIVG